jgi:hypothetical protein
MTTAESESTTGGESADGATGDEPSGSADAADRAVSWGPSEPNRLRSFSIGGLAGILVAAVVWILRWLPIDALVLISVLLLVAPLLLVLVNVADQEATGTERRTFRERLRLRWDWVGVYMGWTVSGAVVIGGATWVLWTIGGAVAVINTVPMAVGLLPALLQQEMDATTTVDPEAGVIETERPARTKRQSLDWAVGVRRFDLFTWSLFVFSNRGKRWYKGPHSLSVPAEVADAVEPLLLEMVDRNDSPPRIGLRERIVIGAIGVGILGIGPLLYLLSGERAMLLTVLGPSALVAHFAQLHARRG